MIIKKKKILAIAAIAVPVLILLVGSIFTGFGVAHAIIATLAMVCVASWGVNELFVK